MKLQKAFRSRLVGKAPTWALPTFLHYPGPMRPARCGSSGGGGAATAQSFPPPPPGAKRRVIGRVRGPGAGDTARPSCGAAEGGR